MTRFSAMRPAMTAAVCTAGNSSCADFRTAAMHIALILDAMILASIFVALITLSSLLGLILITLIILLGTTAHRLKDTPPAFV